MNFKVTLRATGLACPFAAAAPLHAATKAPVRPPVSARPASVSTLLAGSLAVLLAVPSAARAADEAWSTAPLTNTFTGVNWTPGQVPGAATATIASGDSLFFGPSSITSLNNNAPGFDFLGLTFNSDAAAFVIGDGTAALNAGSAFNLTGGITNNSLITQNINNPFTVAATRTITMNGSGGNITLGGNISGAGGLTLARSAGASGAALALAGANSYAGVTTLGSGTIVSVRNSTALGTAAGGTVLNNTSGTGASVQLEGGIVVAGETLAFNGTGSNQVNNLSNALANISGNNQWTGAITANTTAGNVRFSSDAGSLLISGPVNISGVAGNSLVLTGGSTGANTVSGTIANTASATGVIKVGTGAWTLTGPNTYTGITNIREGTLSVAAIGNAGAVGPLGTNGVISLGDPSTGATGVLLYTGATGETTNRGISLTGTTGGGAIRADNPAGVLRFTGNTTAVAGTKTLVLQGSGAGEFAGVISNGAGLVGVAKSGTGVWSLTGTNTYTGSTSVQDGILNTTTINNAGVAGNLGAGATVNLGAGGTTGTLVYNGAGETTDRVVNLAGTTGGGRIQADHRAGTLAFTANATATGLGGKTLTLQGTGNALFSGAIVNSTSNATGVTKAGGGTWTLSGPSTYTGNTTVAGGSLIYDHSANDANVAGFNLLVLSDGNLTLRAAPAGATAETATTLQFGSSALNYTSTTLKLDSNGGAGFTLAATGLQGTTSVLRMDLIDLSGSAANAITVGNTIGNLLEVNDVLLANAAAAGSGRANLIVRDSTGYGFATLNGAIPASNNTSGTIGRLQTFTPLPASGSSNTVNYLRNTPGTFTTSGTLNFNTLTLDTTAGAIGLTLGTGAIAPSGVGRGLLLTGGNDATVTSSATLVGSLFVNNYLDPGATFNMDVNIGGTPIIIGGTGFTSYSGTGFGNIGTGGGFNLFNGVFRVTRAQDLAGTAAPIRISTGAVLEIGADLNGAVAGDFSRALGTGDNNVALYFDSGLSAAGANRTVNFGGAGAQLTWGSGAFLSASDGVTDGGHTLKLSSPRSDATLTLENPISLNGRNRIIEVADGSAAVDATLSGAISGTGVGLTKTGAGTLNLTGSSSFSGTTLVNAGRLLVNGGGNLSASSTIVNSGGVLGGTGILGPVLVSAGGTLAPGNSIGAIATGSLTFANAGTLEAEIEGTVLGGLTNDVVSVFGSVTLDPGSLLNLRFDPALAGGMVNNFLGLISNDGTEAINGTFANAPAGGFTTFTSGASLYTFQYLYNGGSNANDFGLLLTSLATVPEPSRALLLLAGLGILAGRRRRRE